MNVQQSPCSYGYLSYKDAAFQDNEQSEVPPCCAIPTPISVRRWCAEQSLSYKLTPEQGLILFFIPLTWWRRGGTRWIVSLHPIKLFLKSQYEHITEFNLWWGDMNLLSGGWNYSINSSFGIFDNFLLPWKLFHVSGRYRASSNVNVISMSILKRFLL